MIADLPELLFLVNPRQSESQAESCGLVQIANALTEILKSSAFYTVDRQTGKFRVGAGGVGQNILLRMARSIPSKDDSVPHSLSSQSRMYFRMAHAARLFA